MTERSVANIVEKRRQPRYLPQPLADVRPAKRVLFKNLIERHSRQMANTQGVDVAVMGGTRETEFGKSQLLNGSQPLKGEAVEDSHLRAIDFNRTVNGI